MMVLFTIGILKVTEDRQAQGKEEDKVKVNMKDIWYNDTIRDMKSSLTFLAGPLRIRG